MKKIILIILAAGWFSPVMADNFCYHIYDINNGELIRSLKEPPHELTLPQSSEAGKKKTRGEHLVITIDSGDCGFENSSYNLVIDDPRAS